MCESRVFARISLDNEAFFSLITFIGQKIGIKIYKKYTTLSNVNYYTGNPPDHKKVFSEKIPRLSEIPFFWIRICFLFQSMNPYYIFQIYSVTVWLAQDYVIYSALILLMSVLAITLNVFETRKVSDVWNLRKNIANTEIYGKRSQKRKSTEKDRKHGNLGKPELHGWYILWTQFWVTTPGAIFTNPSQLCDRANLLFGPIHHIVHWLPNKKFVSPHSCEGFVNIAPGPVNMVRGPLSCQSKQPMILIWPHVTKVSTNSIPEFAITLCK
jgi:hypothetical protein